ncbi:Protein N-terminal asparagine amidohydrolase [Pitangus sulphuratus]|nr:Protein N-terminal asparagine amidohydrolase [Pitangus sulphuratus]
MPLLVNGARVDLARPTGDMIRAHPHLEEKAKLLRSQPAQTVEPKGLLYVQQREFAVTTPKDGSVSILGSEDATTCHIVVLRHTGAFDLQPDDVHLVTFCVTELNDREEQDIHFPIIYGIAVNVKTAEIFPATFPEKGPDEDLRSAHVLTGAPLTNIYDAKTEQLRIGPYFWGPFPHVDFWLEQDDAQILQFSREEVVTQGKRVLPEIFPEEALKICSKVIKMIWEENTFRPWVLIYPE